jgi:hypothetical protein
LEIERKVVRWPFTFGCVGGLLEMLIAEESFCGVEVAMFAAWFFGRIKLVAL